MATTATELLVVAFNALAPDQGKDLFLPSDSPYRRRWGTWENALLHFGYEPEEVSARLEPGRERSDESLRRFQFGAGEG